MVLKDPRGRLIDMRDASRAIRRYLKDTDRADYLKDDLLQAAVERKLEVISEASGHSRSI